MYSLERFVLRWIIQSAMDGLDDNELLSIEFLMSARCAYSRKHFKVFYTNLWVNFFLIWKYQKEIHSTLS